MKRLLPLLPAFALLPVLSGCGSALPEACSLKPESGRCRAAFTRYWFDARGGTCEAFIWGGCGGVVPFETLEDCQRECRAPAVPAEPAKNPVPAEPAPAAAP